jgi:hypothetical protein
MKQAYGEEALGRSAVAQTLCTGERQFGRWWAYQSAKNGQNWLKIKEFAKLVRANCSQTVDKIWAAEGTGISHGTCHKILSDDVNMSRITQRSVPRDLTQD